MTFPTNVTRVVYQSLETFKVVHESFKTIWHVAHLGFIVGDFYLLQLNEFSNQSHKSLQFLVFVLNFSPHFAFFAFLFIGSSSIFVKASSLDVDSSRASCEND